MSKLRKIFAEGEIDVRSGLTTNYYGVIGENDYGNGTITTTHLITADLNGEEVGSIRLTHYHFDQRSLYAGRDKVHIDLIKVNDQYQNLGIGQLLLKAFGDLYSQVFDRLPVSADFHNPVAEYAYRKAISLGWISGWALDDDKLKRNYTKKDKTLWKDLRQKIPNMYRGSNNKRLLKKLAEDKTDFRSRVQIDFTVENTNEDEDFETLSYHIYAKLDGDQIGDMEFKTFETLTDYEDSYVDVDMVYVKSQYEGFGIGQLMYKKFGEIYNENCYGWPIARIYVNPVAEYAFKKAVSLGWIPDVVLEDESRVNRLYKKDQNLDDTDDEFKEQYHNMRQLYQDLRNKLPEQYRGQEAIKSTELSKLADSSKIDMRNITISYSESEEDGDYVGAEKQIEYTIDATLPDGIDVGYMSFIAFYNAKKPKHIHEMNRSLNYLDQDNNIIYVESVHIDEDYRNCGIGQLLYKKFGEIYNSKYNGWPVGRYYVNPVAEYAFRKAVSLGWINETAINDKYVKRDRYDRSLKYTNTDELWTDLRNKLPEQYKGPEDWASSSDYRLRKFATTEVSPIEVTERDINSRARKIEIFRDGNLLGDLKYEVYPEAKYLYINYVDVQEEYRKNGVATLLYKTLSEKYKAEYDGWKIGRVFINPVAEYAYTKAVAQGWFPESTLDNMKRDYNEQDEELWRNELEPKIQDFRSKKVV